MALVKYNNNSISSLTTAGQLASGSLVPISEQTASGSASIEFTTGIDSTYPMYLFKFINGCIFLRAGYYYKTLLLHYLPLGNILIT